MEVLPELTAVELSNLCLELALTVPEICKDGNGVLKKGKLFKFVMKYLLGLETTVEDEGKAKFVQIYTYLAANIKPVPEEEEEKTEEVVDEKPSIVDIKALTDLAKTLGMEVKPAPELKSLLQRKTSKSEPPITKPVTTRPAIVLKDLKLDGVIGGETDKNRMTFSSLCYQISNAQKLGHSEQTICNAILTAIAPTNNLRTFFEMRPRLMIKSMLSKLKNLYKEKDSTTTLIELSKAAQSSSETCLAYGTRLINLRDKVVLLAESEGCPQEATGLSKKLMKSFFVGLRNGNVRNELRENCKHLYNKGGDLEEDDDEFMSMITEAMANEAERNERLSESKKAEILLMQTNITNKENGKAVSFKDMKENAKKEKCSQIVQMEELKLEQVNQSQALAAVVAQLAEIKDVLIADRPNPATPVAPLIQQLGHNNTQQLNRQQAPPSLLPPPLFPGPPPQPPSHFVPRNNTTPPYQQYVPPHRRKCANCERDNRFRCFHCFHCGSNTHQINACPTKNV